MTATQAQSGKKKLLGEFSGATYEQWKVEAEKLLKGAPFDKKLLTPTPEGILVRPIYNRADVQELPHLNGRPGFPGFGRGVDAGGYLTDPWKISQELPSSTPEEFNAVARQDLMRGQTELNMLLDVASAQGQDPDHAAVGEVGACGTSVAMLRDLEVAFRDIYLDCVPLFLRSGISGLPLAALLQAYVEKTGLAPAKLTGCIEMDPVAVLAREGSLPLSLDQAFNEMALLLRHAGVHMPKMQVVGVSSQLVHDGGGNAVQELGYALATGVCYLRELQQCGIEPAQAAPRFRFSLAAGSNFFMEVAKFRAARLLWSRVLEASGLDPALAPMRIHARTSLWNKSAIDPYVNLLRATTESFSAVLGGCQSLNVGAFDEIFRVPDEFSRRIARNTQIILQEECDLARVIDPAGGSWYVEWLTDAVAEKAWAFFQEIEQQGSVVGALDKGWLQEQVQKGARQRWQGIAQRREVMVGVNNYPNPKEEPLPAVLPDYQQIRTQRANEILSYRICAESEADAEIIESLTRITNADRDGVVAEAVVAAGSGASLGEITRALRHADHGKTRPVVSPIPLRRASQQYEALHKACRSHALKHGQAPQVLQVNIGPSRMYRLRADWTTGFFQVGGLQVLSQRDFKDAAEAAAALTDCGARLVVICSTDETYATVVPELARALHKARPEVLVLVAGTPGEHEGEWKSAGVYDFVNVRVNNHEMLHGLLQKIGVQV